MIAQMRFEYENPEDSQNYIYVYPDDGTFRCEPKKGAIKIQIGDEQAVGSYNSSFDLYITLPPAQVTALRDFLTKMIEAAK